MNSQIVIKHPKIVDFYTKHKHLDIEYINLALIDFYEKHIMNQENITKNVASEILANLHSLQTGLENQVLHKFYELKHSYLEDLKPLLDTNMLKMVEKIEKEHVQLLDKTHQIIQTMVPNHQTQFQAEHELMVRNFREEMLKLVEPMKHDMSMDKIHLLMSQEYHKLLAQIQQQVLSHEQRIQQKMGEIKELSSTNQTYQEKISQDMSTFLSQYKISQKKGEFGEQLLHQCLCSLFPAGEIIQTTGLTSAGDFMMKRLGKPTILFENKNYESANVPKKEVDKFLVDIEQQQCSGIFMSQKSGIALKKNFEIDVHHGHVLIYLHHMNYDQDKLLAACDIIDRLSEKFKEHPQDEFSISQEVLQTIHQQYQTFLEKRERILTQLNDNHKKVVADIRELSMGELNTILSTVFASTQTTNLVCTICDNFTATNSRSLQAHIPQCRKKHDKYRYRDIVDATIPVLQNEILHEISAQTHSVTKLPRCANELVVLGGLHPLCEGFKPSDQVFVCDICNDFTANNTRSLNAHKGQCRRKTNIPVKVGI